MRLTVERAKVGNSAMLDLLAQPERQFVAASLNSERRSEARFVSIVLNLLRDRPRNGCSSRAAVADRRSAVADRRFPPKAKRIGAMKVCEGRVLKRSMAV